MEKIRSSNLAKLICYVLIPILVIIAIVSMIHIIFLEEYNIKDETKYEQTQDFANRYLQNIVDRVNECKQITEEYSNFVKIQNEDENVYYSENNSIYAYNGGIEENIDYIIIDKLTGKIYTNIKSNDYEEEKTKIQNSKEHWNYISGKIETDIEKMNTEELVYSNNYRLLKQDNNSEYSKEKNIENFDVYSRFDINKTNSLTTYKMINLAANFGLEHKILPIVVLPLTAIALLIIAIYLIWSIGYNKNEEVKLSFIDKVPYEILGFVGIWIIMIFTIIGAECINLAEYISIIGFFAAYIICYVVCAVIGISTIKRIKARKFLQGFLLYRILRYFFRKMKNIYNTLTNKKPETKRIFLCYVSFLVITSILGIVFKDMISNILIIIFWVWTYYKIKKYVVTQEKIRQALQDIYEGKTDIQLDENELKGTLQEMSIYIKDIADGFSNAIEQNVKAERLKAELITNVSHDIKTPLTSIINYVDLLKKENIQEEKIRNYIEILDQKSKRLKKLTEDVVEASKASSGNLKLNIEEIDFIELLNQTIGEFKDKFEEKNLKIVVQKPEENVKIKADSRYVYRIVENLFGNITKYAVEDSRVYVDIAENDENYDITIKNISKEKLNITSEELMQRFVRGDKSRNTEGSGLGLSIAQSLTSIQGGELTIKIDGDLFKVNIRWPKI